MSEDEDELALETLAVSLGEPFGNSLKQMFYFLSGVKRAPTQTSIDRVKELASIVNSLCVECLQELKGKREE